MYVILRNNLKGQGCLETSYGCKAMLINSILATESQICGSKLMCTNNIIGLFQLTFTRDAITLYSITCPRATAVVTSIYVVAKVSTQCSSCSALVNIYMH